MNQKHVKWVIAHEPIGLFLEVAKTFATEVNEKTNGMFDIEVLSLSDYANKYNDGKQITKDDLIALVNTGAIEMSHIYTSWLGGFNKDMFALDLPFMFRDHDHADAVLEGEIGAGLLAGVAANSNVQPMSFTYSGGFKVVPANFDAANVDAWEGQDIRTSTSPVSNAIFRSLGANVRNDISLENMAEHGLSGDIDGGESTYVRVLPLKQNEAFSHVNDTAHSLLLTSIIVNQDFLATLDTDVQKIMSDAAFLAARQERRQSVADVPGIVAELDFEGVKIVNLSDEQAAELKAATAPVYELFKDAFTPGLIEDLKKAGK